MTTIFSNSAPRPTPRGERGTQWVNGVAGVVLAFLWGLSEATFFFVVPDVLISLAALLKPTRAWRPVLAAIAGATLGGMLLYGWSARDLSEARAFVAHVPFVRTRMLAKVHRSFQKRGAGAMFLGPLTGTPYKIYATEAPGFLSRRAFLPATVLARAERFLFVWAAFAFLGFRLRKRFRISRGHFLIGHACFWICLYGLYWGDIVLR